MRSRFLKKKMFTIVCTAGFLCFSGHVISCKTPAVSSAATAVKTSAAPNTAESVKKTETAPAAAVSKTNTAGTAKSGTTGNGSAAEAKRTPAQRFTDNLQQVLQKGGIEKALASFKDMPDECKNDPDVNYLHASLLLSAGDIKQADEKTAELLKKNPNDKQIKLLSAMVAKAGGDTKKSKDIIKDILKQDPGDPDANAAFADTFMLTRNFKQANVYFRKGLERDPEHRSSLFGYAQTSWYLDKIDVAKKTFTKLTELDPTNDMAWAYLAKLAGESRNYAKALDYIKTALKYENNSYYHWLDAGSYYLGVNDYDNADKAWTRAIEIDPNYFLAYTYRGGLRDERARYKEALADYQNVIRCNPKYYYAYESAALLAWRVENWEEALKNFIKAQEGNPDNISYALMVSAVYRKMGKTKASKDFLTKVIKPLDRKSLDYAMARLYYDDTGDNAVLNKVVNQDSRTTKGKMLYYMALFYELTGKQSLANKLYLEVADMNAPLFFEYRLTQWAVEKMKPQDKKAAQTKE